MASKSPMHASGVPQPVVTGVIVKGAVNTTTERPPARCTDPVFAVLFWGMFLTLAAYAVIDAPAAMETFDADDGSSSSEEAAADDEASIDDEASSTLGPFPTGHVLTTIVMVMLGTASCATAVLMWLLLKHGEAAHVSFT